MNSAVLFLVFNRPDTTTKVFQAIRNAKPPRLYIASDGPRPFRQNEAEIVNSIREYLTSNIDWPCDVKVLFRDENYGCGPNVSSAISWFFENEEMGIILEDDCLPSDSFFHYCDELLDRYKNDDKIMMISGDNFLFSQLDIEHSYSFCKYQLIWGWASWRRAWEKYDPYMAMWPQFRKSKIYKKTAAKYDERMYWNKIFDKTYLEGLKSTWDYQWLYSMWINQGLSVFPNVNLISNIGFGADATHTFGVSKCSEVKANEIAFPLVHPAAVVENRKANHIIQTNFYMPHRGAFYLAFLVKNRIEKLIRSVM